MPGPVSAPKIDQIYECTPQWLFNYETRQIWAENTALTEIWVPSHVDRDTIQTNLSGDLGKNVLHMVLWRSCKNIIIIQEGHPY